MDDAGTGPAGRGGDAHDAVGIHRLNVSELLSGEMEEMEIHVQRT